MQGLSRYIALPLCLLACLWLLVCFPQGAAGGDSLSSGGEDARHPAFPPDCPDAVPHPGTINVYVNEELRVIPYAEYPMAFINKADLVDGKECNRRIPVVEVHEFYRDLSGKYVSRSNAYWLTITGYDANGDTFTADGVRK